MTGTVDDPAVRLLGLSLRRDDAEAVRRAPRSWARRHERGPAEVGAVLGEHPSVRVPYWAGRERRLPAPRAHLPAQRQAVRDDFR